MTPWSLWDGEIAQGTHLVSQEASFSTARQLLEMLENLSTVRKLCSVWNKNTRVGQTLKEQAHPHLLWHFKPGKGLCFLMLYWQMWELLANVGITGKNVTFYCQIQADKWCEGLICKKRVGSDNVCAR